MTDQAAARPGGARLTPYELAFGEAGFEAGGFPRLQAEADARGVDPSDPHRFAFLTVAGEAVREVIPTDASPEAMDQYRLLLYHAFNFWRFGKRLYVVEPAVARFLVEAAPDLEGWELSVPHSSLYVQLPPNLFWGSIATDIPPEPVDGFFVSCHREHDAQGEEFEVLEVVMVLGVRPDRAGFSLVSFDAELVPGIAAEWAEAPGREGARDFENVLPGGELAGLYSIVTLQEALKLLAWILWYVDRHSTYVSTHDAPERREGIRHGSTPLSHLPFHRVSLHEEDGG